MTVFNLKELARQGGFNAGNLIAVDKKLYAKTLRCICINVKRDPITKQAILLTGISAYTDEPINLFLLGPSSLGKTYIATKVMEFFPKEDVWIIGKASRKFLVRQYGVLVDENDNPIDWNKQPDKNAPTGEKAIWASTLAKAKMIIDMTHKILVFLDVPDMDLFTDILSILSHDRHEISFPYVDTSHGIITKNVVVRGAPACIFCSTVKKQLEQLATRSFTISPEATTEKFLRANQLSGEKWAHPFDFGFDEDMDAIQNYIRSLKEDGCESLKVMFPFGKEFGTLFPHILPRSMRDINHIKGYVNSLARFLRFQRPMFTITRTLYNEDGSFLKTDIVRKAILASRYDFETIMYIWQAVKETTEKGIPSYLISFFNDTVIPEYELCNDASNIQLCKLKRIANRWNIQHPENYKSSTTLREWLDVLDKSGLISIEDPPKGEDQRAKVIEVLAGKINKENPALQFAPIFKFDLLKEWIKIEIENTKAKYQTDLAMCEVQIIENEISKKVLNIEELYEQFYGKPQSIFVFSNTKIQPSLTKTSEKINVKNKAGQSLFISPEDITEIVKLTSNYGTEECCVCNTKTNAKYQVNFKTGDWGFLCGDCGEKLKKLKGWA